MGDIREELEADYHANHSAWSKSMLTVFRQRRRLAEARYITHTAPSQDASPEMERGTLTHLALLEPDGLQKRYAVYPESVLAKNGAVGTNAAKDFRAEQEAAGRIVLKAEEFATVKAMVASVEKVCGHWLSLPSLRERSIYWTHEQIGIPLKCRIDWLIPTDDRVIVFDLKTTSDVTPWAFKNSCEKFAYWLQDSHYREGVEAAFGKRCEFYFVAVESVYPFACAVYSLDLATQVRANGARFKLLQQLELCLARNDFSEPWENNVTQLALRPWAIDADDSLTP